jgi:acetyl esterase/lipase
VKKCHRELLAVSLSKGETMSEYSNRIRKEFAAGDMVRDAGLKTPDDVIRYDNISYGNDASLNLLDVYRPRNAGKDKLPVIMIVHGGAWVYGDKNVYQFYAMSLAQRGFAVVNFSYRLAPEVKFPAPIEDICSVCRWMNREHEKYGLDLNNVFAAGDSAGGHLLALFTSLLTNKDYRELLQSTYSCSCFRIADEETGNEIRLRAIALNCGKYDLTQTDNELEMKELFMDFMPEGGTDKEITIVSPLRFVTGNYPPVFLMTCVGDYLKDQAPLMARVLVMKNVPFEFRFYSSADEELQHVFHCNMRLSNAAKCNDDECSFFMEYIDRKG